MTERERQTPPILAHKHTDEPSVCYHTDMWVFDLDGHEVGVVGCAVGASFAVLVAEEMFASGCELLVSVTSLGQIMPQGAPPYFIQVDRALRDKGTIIAPPQVLTFPHHITSRSSPPPAPGQVRPRQGTRRLPRHRPRKALPARAR